MNRLRSRILIPFSINVVFSKITHLFFARTSDSRLSISITLWYASTISYTFMDCCNSTFTFVDSYSFASTTFPSPMSLYVVYASTNFCSTSSSSFDSSMNIGSIDVAFGLVYPLAHQRLLLLRINSTIDDSIIFIL